MGTVFAVPKREDDQWEKNDKSVIHCLFWKQVLLKVKTKRKIRLKKVDRFPRNHLGSQFYSLLVIIDLHCSVLWFKEGGKGKVFQKHSDRLQSDFFRV